MKSKVRIKAFVLLGFAILGLLQAFSLVPWSADSPIMVGLLIIVISIILTGDLQCEECGDGLIVSVSNLGKFKGEERAFKRKELMQKGHRLFPYRKHCVHCDMERY